MARVTPGLRYGEISDIAERLSGLPGIHEMLRVQSDLESNNIVLSASTVRNIYKNSIVHSVTNLERATLGELGLHGITNANQALSLYGRQFLTLDQSPDMLRLKMKFLASNSTFDLALFNKTTQSNLAQEYANRVLQISDVLKTAGVPAYVPPTSNQRARFFQYIVDPVTNSSIEEGIDPSLNLIGRSSINIKKSFGASEAVESVAYGPRTTIKTGQGIKEEYAQRKKNVGTKIS